MRVSGDRSCRGLRTDSRPTLGNHHRCGSQNRGCAKGRSARHHPIERLARGWTMIGQNRHWIAARVLFLLASRRRIRQTTWSVSPTGGLGKTRPATAPLAAGPVETAVWTVPRREGRSFVTRRNATTWEWTRASCSWERMCGYHRCPTTPASGRPIQNGLLQTG